MIRGKKCTSCCRVFSCQTNLRRHIQNATNENLNDPDTPCLCSSSARFGQQLPLSKHTDRCDESHGEAKLDKENVAPCICLTEQLLESGVVSRAKSSIHRWYDRDIYAGDPNLAESKLPNVVLTNPSHLDVKARGPWKRKLADLNRVELNDTNIETLTLSLPTNVHVYEFKKYLLEAFPGVEFSISAAELATRYHYDWSIESPDNKVGCLFD